MGEAVSISKSVARTFRVLELFAAERRPLTAADIGRRLALPQPSTRALLKTLVGLGYLAYTDADRTYWPTPQLTALGQWLGSEQRVPLALTLAVERIAGQAEETASLCALRDGNVEILHVCKARHPVALQLENGPGVAAWRTAVGRALLATLPEADAASLVAAWLQKERTPAGRRVLLGLARELKRARADGFLAAYNLFLAGVGAVCVPVPAAGQGSLPGPLVVAVAGLCDRIRSREGALVRLIRGELRRSV
ncbi:MAG: helix-turn-helix domain-containing protein [Gammaproteobacteria bacterium]